MKNTIKIIICLALILGVFVCFSACDNSKEPAATDETVVKQNIIGRYELIKIEWEDGTVASDETLQSSEDAMGDMYIELFGDGTAVLSLYGQIKDMEFSNDKLWQTDYANNSYDFSVGNGKVTLKNSGDTYTFVKQ